MKDLLKIIQQQSATIDSLTNELALLREQVAYLTQKLYGKSSEKSVCPSGQLSLFEMEDFFAWCRRQSVLPGSKLGRAIEYSLKYEETFKAILKDGHLVLSNNLAERAIKSLVMGRSKRVQWTLLA
jgi:hypothetical protein